jgi:excisionase family DNA binding protein
MSLDTSQPLKLEPLLLRPEEAAKVLSLSRARLYQLIAEGVIPSIKLGGSRRISVSALQDWIEAENASQNKPTQPLDDPPAAANR